MGIIATIIIGAIAGWLGSFVGNWLFGVLGIHLGEGWIGAILTGAIGAIVVLFLINLITKKK